MTRGRTLFRHEVEDPQCAEPATREYDVGYEASVRIWGRGQSWSIDGTLRTPECGP